jgi:hypothetical protein
VGPMDGLWGAQVTYLCIYLCGASGIYVYYRWLVCRSCAVDSTDGEKAPPAAPKKDPLQSLASSCLICVDRRFERPRPRAAANLA